MKTNLIGRRVSFYRGSPSVVHTGVIVVVRYTPAKISGEPTLDVWVEDDAGRLEHFYPYALTLLPTPTSEVPNGR